MQEYREHLTGAPYPDVSIRVVRTEADMDELTTWLAALHEQPLGLDSETNGLYPWDPEYRLRLVQMSDGMVAHNIVVAAVNSIRLTEMIRQHPLWVAHYAEADIRFLARGLPGSIRLGDDTPHVIDTQPLLATFDPRTVTSREKVDPRIARGKGLKETVTRWLTPRMHELELERDAVAAEQGRAAKLRKKADQLGHWFAAVPDDDELYHRYSGLDPLCTLRLYCLMRDAVAARGQWPLAVTDMHEQWRIDVMTYHGLYVDAHYARWYDAELAATIERYAEWLATFGIARSAMGPAVGKAFTDRGVSSPVTSQEGKASWDKAALKQLIKEDSPAAPLAEAVMLVRAATKFRATYLAPMLYALDYDGYLHCSMRAVGTITGRMSAMRPPLQQLPKKDPRVRAAICAPPGHVIVSADLSQGEPRVMAALSGDRNYLAEILKGNLNAAIATLVFGDAFDPAQAKVAGTPHYLMYMGAKAGWLGWCYGAGDRKVASTLGIDESRGHEITSVWAASFPDLADLKTRLDGEREITLITGRAIPLWDRYWITNNDDIPHVTKPRSRKGLNAATQGTQREVLVHMHGVLCSLGWGWAVRFILHDEILGVVPEWMAEDFRAALETAMTMTFRGVPMTCEATIEGRTWLPQPTEFADPDELSVVDELDDVS